jgi:hypothetical protein
MIVFRGFWRARGRAVAGRVKIWKEGEIILHVFAFRLSETKGLLLMRG